MLHNTPKVTKLVSRMRKLKFKPCPSDSRVHAPKHCAFPPHTYYHMILFQRLYTGILSIPAEWKRTWRKYFALALPINGSGRKLLGLMCVKTSPELKFVNLVKIPSPSNWLSCLFLYQIFWPTFQCDLLLRVSFLIFFLMWCAEIVYIPRSLQEHQLIQKHALNNKLRWKIHKYLSTIVCLLPKRPHFPLRQLENFNSLNNLTNIWLSITYKYQ